MQCRRSSYLRAARTKTTSSACCAPTGLLCVYGSGFGTAPADGYFRIVFLAPPAELDSFYDAIETFTADFLAE